MLSIVDFRDALARGDLSEIRHGLSDGMLEVVIRIQLAAGGRNHGRGNPGPEPPSGWPTDHDLDVMSTDPYMRQPWQ